MTIVSRCGSLVMNGTVGGLADLISAELPQHLLPRVVPDRAYLYAPGALHGGHWEHGHRAALG